MRDRTMTAAAVVGLSALVLSGCTVDVADSAATGSTTSSESTSANTSPEDDASNASDSGSAGAPGVDVVVDGEPAAGEWVEPTCEEPTAQDSTTKISSSTAGGGSLVILLSETSGLKITLRLEGEGVDLLNYDDAPADFSDGVLTFEGTLTDNPHSQLVTHDVAIDITCPQ